MIRCLERSDRVFWECSELGNEHVGPLSEGGQKVPVLTSSMRMALSELFFRDQRDGLYFGCWLD